ncbi:hypothetical protein NL108_017181 [Boleophthalmus pectinirostris]|nr:hypothetical protein NL108_017181 [Boleophthalmus pectinirostris]
MDPFGKSQKLQSPKCRNFLHKQQSLNNLALYKLVLKCDSFISSSVHISAFCQFFWKHLKVHCVTFLVGLLTACLHGAVIALPGMFHTEALNSSVSMKISRNETGPRYSSDLWRGVSVYPEMPVFHAILKQ